MTTLTQVPMKPKSPPVEAIVFKHLHRRPYCPGTEYNGDRPCLWWAPFLMRLAERGLIGNPATRLTQLRRRK
jgi:hypothetical protein